MKFQPQGKAPVLVYFHGGGFIAGAGHPHRANYLMDEKNLVFVTINYRIALLGKIYAFLNLLTQHVTIHTTQWLRRSKNPKTLRQN